MGQKAGELEVKKPGQQNEDNTDETGSTATRDTNPEKGIRCVSAIWVIRKKNLLLL